MAPGLRNKGNVAGLGHGGAEAGIHAHAGVRVGDAQAVGAEEADAMFLGHGLHVLFQFDPLAADFLETGCNHDAPLDAPLGSLFDRVRHMARRHDENGHIHLIGNLQERGVSFHTLDGLALGVHRVKNSLIAPIEQISENGKPQAAGAVCCADHGNRLRAQYVFNAFHV